MKVLIAIMELGEVFIKLIYVSIIALISKLVEPLIRWARRFERKNRYQWDMFWIRMMLWALAGSFVMLILSQIAKCSLTMPPL